MAMEAMLDYLAKPNPPYAPIHNARELFNAALVADSDLAYLERHEDMDDVPFPPEYNRWGVSGAINTAAIQAPLRKSSSTPRNGGTVSSRAGSRA